MPFLVNVSLQWFFRMSRGGTGAVLVLRWLWGRVNLWSEVFAIVASLIVASILIFPSRMSAWVCC